MDLPPPATLHSKTRYGVPVLSILAVFVLVVYFATAPRTNTWWFGSSYKMAAVTFGINFPPGSLILTLLGWLVVQLPLGISKAFTLNLFASVVGVFTFCMTAVLALRLVRRYQIVAPAFPETTTARAFPDRTAAFASTVAVGFACLTLAYSETTWRYAIEFMPYILTVAFTTLILWAVLNWWDRKTAEPRDRWLFLIMLLFGLDLSVHRTNLLMLPGFLLWVLICRPRSYARIRSWLIGAVGLIAGSSFQLLTIPIAARHPIVNAGDPSNWSRFYYYVSLQQYGGGWLVNMWPRKASFWDVQIADYLRVFGENFASYGGVLAVLPLVFGLVGIISLWRRDWKLAVGLLILFVFSSLGAIVYFNLPEGFLQRMDRHYMPSFVVFAVLIAYGTATALHYAWTMRGGYRRTSAVALILLLAASMGLKQLARNYDSIDASKDYFARDYAENILDTVQPGAIVFVAGDNYHTVSYLQIVEHIRPDVIVLNPSLCNTGWYVEQALSRHPDLPLVLSDEEIAGLGPMLWKKTTIVTAVTGSADSFQLPDGSSPLDSFSLVVPPTVADRYIFAQDWVVIKMLTENQWRRPVYFTSPPDWLREHARLEGLVSRLIPQNSVRLNPDILRENLLERYRYRGYADPSVPIGRYSQLVGRQLAGGFCELAEYEGTHGDAAGCTQTKRELNRRLPADRIDAPPDMRRTIEELCRIDSR